MIGDRRIFFGESLQRSNLCASHRRRRWLTRAGHARPLGGASPLPNLTEVKGSLGLAQGLTRGPRVSLCRQRSPLATRDEANEFGADRASTTGGSSPQQVSPGVDSDTRASDSRREGPVFDPTNKGSIASGEAGKSVSERNTRYALEQVDVPPPQRAKSSPRADPSAAPVGNY